MLRMAHKDETIRAKRNCFQPRIALGKRNQAQINDITKDVIIDLIGAPIFDMDIHAGIIFHETLNVRRQVVESDAVHGGNMNISREYSLNFLQPALKRVEAGKDALGVIINDFTFGSEPEIFLAAFDEE